MGRYAGSIAGKELQKLTSDDIQKLYSQLLSKGLSGATVLQFHRIISKALTVAVGKGKILSNPCAKGKVFPPAKEQHEMRVWDEDTLYTFFQEAKDSRFRDFYHLAVLTGMRRSEICALTWDNVDFNSRTLSVMGSIHRIKGLGMVIAPPKTRRSRRQIDLSDEVVDLLRTVRGQQVAMKAVLGNEWNSDNWVFANPEGGPTVPDQVTQEFARIIKKAALPHIRLHDLRHQCATLLFKRGVSAKVMSELLGHSSISITLDTYSHVLPGMQREAVSLLDGIVTRQNRH